MIGILFDLDGTLLDTLQDLTDAVNVSLAQYGYPPRSDREVRSFLGNGTAYLIEKSVPQGADPAPVLQTYRRHYPAHSQIKTAPYPGILQALEQVKSKYPVAVVSNKLDVAVKSMCEHYFGDIYALGEKQGCPRKPQPDMLYCAMEAIEVDRCVYVGDSEVDVITAGNANVPCVCVTWGFRDEDELLEAGAKYLCHDPEQLAAVIENAVEEWYGK